MQSLAYMAHLEIKPNRTVEEGIAYSWGNAYYTKTNGEMIE
jgi:hypothetical protein